MEKLDKILVEVEAKVDQFYQRAIDLHNNQNLRSLPGRDISIYDDGYGDRLYYGQNGFYAAVSKCITPGNYLENGVYRYPKYDFYAKFGKLYVKSHRGKKEMLHLFPKLTLETLEEKLVEGIKESPLFKGMQK